MRSPYDIPPGLDVALSLLVLPLRGPTSLNGAVSLGTI